MGKEGMQCSEHTLEYSLSHDASAEIRQALQDAALRTWKELQSLDAVVERELPDGIEREETHVYQQDNEVRYRTEEAALPVNYTPGEYPTETEEHDSTSNYAFTLTPADVMWETPAEAYEKQLDQKAFSEMMRSTHQEMYASAEIASRVEMYKIGLGYAMRFLLYALKTAGV